jgi:hypothetical protein
LCALASTALLDAAQAAPPKINRLSVRGFQTGATTRVNITGLGLEGSPKLLLGVPIAEQKLVPPIRANAVTVDVTLDAAVAPGIYHLRLQTDAGITPPEIVAIDGLKQVPVVAAADAKPLSTPVAIHGAVTAAEIQATQFAGKKDQTITIDVLARRLGSKLRPVVHLHDAEKKQLAWSPPQTALAGDARLSVKLPADGTYTVAVHDLTYAAPPLSPYRLAIGTFDYADQVFPPVVERNKSPALELVGHFGDKPTTKLDATAAAALTSAEAERLGDVRPLPWPKTSHPAGLRPRVLLSDMPERFEAELRDAKTPAGLPLAVSGRLDAPGAVDLYEIAPGEKIRVEVFADRLGSPLDATVEVRDSKGARLAQADDVAGPDPRLDYDARKTATPLTIAVTDALGRGGPDCVYRLVVTSIDAASQPDFRLTFFEDTENLPLDGTRVFRVAADRQGYDGAIRLKVEGLPNGFTATPVDIPAGADGALVELRRSSHLAPGRRPGADDKSPQTVGQLTIRGEAVDAKPALTRVAESAVHPLAALQPWLKGELAVAAAGPALPFSVAWDENPAKKKSAEANAGDADKLYLGTDDRLAVRVDRASGETGAVRLSLLSTQLTPTGANAQANAAQTLRGITLTVDIAGGKAAKDRGAFAIRVPADLRQAEYDLALKAELLSTDAKTVVAEAFTTPRRFTAAVPLELALDAAATKPVTLDGKSGATVAITGTMKRLKDYAGDVTLTLAGLPANITAPSLIVKGKTDKFKLDIKLPATFALAKLDALKVSATITPDNRRVNTAGKLEVAVPTIEVTKAAGAAVARAEPTPTTKQPKAKPVRKK